MDQQKKAALRNVGKVLCFLLIFFLLATAFNYALYDDSGSYTRLTYHELFQSAENVDILFLGPSLSYCGLDPALLDQSFHANTFNGASAMQTPEGSYAVLVEAAKVHDLKAVYVDIDHRLTELNVQETGDKSKYIIYDYLPCSANRLRYLAQSSNVENWLNILFPARREPMTFHQIADNLNGKQSEAYKNYTYVSNGTQTYAGKGFVSSDIRTAQGAFVNERTISPIADSHLTDDALRYIQKIIDFCKKKDISLVFYCAPMSNFEIAAAGNYDDYISQVSALLGAQGVPFWDFNLLREEYFPDDDSLYFDSRHLNSYGAEIFSDLFGNFFTGKLREEIFYPSYAEKLQHLEKRVYGVEYRFVTDPAEIAELLNENASSVSRLLVLNSIRNGGDVSFRLTVHPDGSGAPYDLEACCGNAMYVLPADEHGAIEIVSILDGNISTAEIPY